jgi:hypothetical protein
MANAYVEISRSVATLKGSAIHGRCLFSEVLAIGAEVTGTAVTAAMLANAGSGGGVARISTDDTACYVAIGATPDADAATATTLTSARRYLGAGLTVDLPIRFGEAVCVKAVS